MSDRFYYRANPDLAAALRAEAEARREFWDLVVTPYVEGSPNNPPVWRRPGEPVCVGFADDRRDDPPPEGLSRAKTRTYLIPLRGQRGQEWRDRIAAFNKTPRPEKVLRRFGVPTEVWGTSRIYFSSWMDLGGPNVAVFFGTELTPVPAALEPMKRSEFYALHEAAMERERAVEGSVSVLPEETPGGTP